MQDTKVAIIHRCVVSGVVGVDEAQRRVYYGWRKRLPEHLWSMLSGLQGEYASVAWIAAQDRSRREELYRSWTTCLSALAHWHKDREPLELSRLFAYLARRSAVRAEVTVNTFTTEGPVGDEGELGYISLLEQVEFLLTTRPGVEAMQKILTKLEQLIQARSPAAVELALYCAELLVGQELSLEAYNLIRDTSLVCAQYTDPFVGQQAAVLAVSLQATRAVEVPIMPLVASACPSCNAFVFYDEGYNCRCGRIFGYS